VLGRTVPPWLSDRVLGPLNATIAMNVFTLAVVLVLWLPLGASSVTALFVVVVLMGIGTGSFVPLGGKWCPLL
jgi:dipeptide/tripeptide permease